MRGVEECLTAGGPWSLEEIENVTGYMSMKDWQLGEQQAEIERLNARLKILQDAQIAAVTQDHRNLFKYTDEVRAALLGDQALQKG